MGNVSIKIQQPDGLILIKHAAALYEAIVPRNVFKIKRRLADRLFSRLVRRRDHYTCVRCHHTHTEKSHGLHVSHFFARRRESTRFNYDNVDSLCTACHFFWSHNEGRTSYSAFKIAQLGAERYEALAREAQRPNTEFMKFNGGRRKHDADNIAAFRLALGRARLLDTLLAIFAKNTGS